MYKNTDQIINALVSFFSLTKIDTPDTLSGWETTVCTKVEIAQNRNILHNLKQNGSTCFQMFHKVGLDTKGLAAAPALKQLALVVGLHVSSQVGSVCKLLPAVGTAEWFLSRV